MPTWRSNLVRNNEQRRHERRPGDGILRLLWDDAGRERIAEAKILNISRTGAKVLLRERVPVRACVMCSSTGAGIRERGSIRYCNASARGYEAGIEFSEAIVKEA